MKSENIFNIVMSTSAENDMISIYNFIADENLNNALKTTQKIENRIDKLSLFPEKGRIAPELELHSIFTFRELIEHPWRIIYKIESSTLYIVAILDGRRNLDELLLKRLLR